MAERFGQAFWPGVNGFISCSYTCSAGISPGTATLVVPIQNISMIQRVGNLVISDGVGAPVVVQNMAIVRSEVVAAGSGKALALSLVDRRRLWKLGGVDGYYNVSDVTPNLGPLLERLDRGQEFWTTAGPFVPGTERRPVDLMRVALTAMGETGFELRAIPDGVRPAIDAKGDTPAQVLQTVAESVGCQVCYQPVANRVVVTPPATSVTLMGLPLIEDHPGLEVADPPSQAVVYADPTLVCDFLPLEAVGVDGDGQIKKINDLSYIPLDGWGPYTPGGHYGGIRQGLCDSVKQARALAKKYLWKMYRVTFDNATWQEKIRPGIEKVTGKLKNPRQIVLESDIVTPKKDALGRTIHDDAYVVGSTARGGGWKKLQKDFGRIDEGFAIDAVRNVVMFNEWCYFATPVGTVSGEGFTASPPTDLYLCTSFRVRNVNTGQFHRAETWGRYGGPPTPPEVIRRPELAATYQTIRLVSIVDGAVGGLGVIKSLNNAPDVTKASQFYLAASRMKYSQAPSSTKTLAGIYTIDPDSGVRQVTWSVGGGSPATTTVSLGCEHATWLRPYPERRRAELVDDLMKVALEKPIKSDELR